MWQKSCFYLIITFLLFSCGGDDNSGGASSGTPSDLKPCFNESIDGGIVTFDASCSEGGSIYSWDFGDGNFSGEETPVHEYQDAGIYTVTLTLSSGFGRAGQEISKSIEIEEFCISCKCEPGSSTASSEFCSTRQKADSACVECSAIINCACDTINVDPGYYVFGSATTNNPSEAYVLQQGVVDDFGSFPPYSERAGFYEQLLYLKTGNIRIIEVGQSENTIFGGNTNTENFPEGNAILNAGVVEENGPAFQVNTAGLYYIGIDLQSQTWYIYRVENLEIIGPANQGWSQGSAINSKSADENEIVFEGQNIAMDAGEFRIRINSNWIINRAAASPPVDDFEILTNFGSGFQGGDENSRYQIGGYSFNFTGQAGKYTISLKHSKGEGMSLVPTFERTGDLNPFDPVNYNWGIIGTATAEGWDGDVDFIYRGQTGGTYLWVGMIYLKDGEFKYRINDGWDFSLGAGDLTHSGSAAGQIGGTDNFTFSALPNQSYYYIKISTSDEGLSWDINIEPGNWGIIGDATPGGWNSSTPLTYAGGGEWQQWVNLTASEFKFRVNDEWEINLGGDLNNLYQDGPNLTVPSMNFYLVTLKTTDFGLTYSATL